MHRSYFFLRKNIVHKGEDPFFHFPTIPRPTNNLHFLTKIKELNLRNINITDGNKILLGSPQNFDVDTTNLIHGLQVFDKEDEIIPHDDYTGELQMPNGDVPYTEMPIRAILYLNPEYMYGTHIHKEEPGWADEDDPRWWAHMWDKGMEIGGQPGQLLIIKPNGNSWHSVGCFNTTLDNRITSNWIFQN